MFAEGTLRLSRNTPLHNSGHNPLSLSTLEPLPAPPQPGAVPSGSTKYTRINGVLQGCERELPRQRPTSSC
jgi:hypothetical protein